MTVEKIILKCGGCGVERRIYPSQVIRYRNIGEHYKCRPCWNMLRRGHPIRRGGPVRQVTISCVECGVLRTYPAASEAALSIRCRSCASKAFGKNNTLNAKLENKITVTCPTCGSERIYKTSYRSRKSDYCIKCKNKGALSHLWNGGGVALVCACGKTTIYRANTAKRLTKDGRKYQCAACFQKNKCGENNPAWRGGVSFAPYPIAWTIELKKSIWDRDKYTCRICHMTRNQKKQRFCVHHIDYDKTNLSQDNLALVCNGCHARTNFNREKWISFFARGML